MASLKSRVHVRKAAYPNGNGAEITATPSVGREMGRTGLRQWAGRIDEEFLPELKWDKAGKIYREMSDNDSTVGGLLNAITLMVRQADSRFESKTEGDERVVFLEECREDMAHSWTDLLAEIARGVLTYGWQVHECVYKLRDEKNSQYPDGKIGWKKLAVRAQDTLYRWDYDEKTQELLAMIQRPAPDYIERRLPLEKLALFRTETIKDNPEGRSILRNAYRPWYFKKNIENIEGVGIERDLAGFPVIYISPQTFNDPTAKAMYETIATAIKRDEQEGLVLPAVFDENGNRLIQLELLSAGGDRQFDTSAVINRYDLRILQLMLADFIQVGHDSVGSKALASTKTNLFLAAITVLLDQIASPFNRQLIPRLLELNGMETEDSPKLIFDPLEERDLSGLADYLSKLSTAGMPLFPNQKLENALYGFARLPIPTTEEVQQRDQAIQDEQQQQLEQQMALTQAGKPEPPKPGAQPAPKEQP